jgi:hypothetical protein
MAGGMATGPRKPIAARGTRHGALSSVCSGARRSLSPPSKAAVAPQTDSIRELQRPLDRLKARLLAQRIHERVGSVSSDPRSSLASGVDTSHPLGAESDGKPTRRIKSR